MQLRKLLPIAIASGLFFMSACHKTTDSPEPDNSAQATTLSESSNQAPSEKTEAANEQAPDLKPETANAETSDGSAKDNDAVSEIPVIPTEFEKANADWSNIQLIFHNCDDIEPEDKARVEMELSKFLRNWNTLRNQKNSAKLAKLYDETAYIRGSNLPHAQIADKLDKSFKKHKDFSQIPGRDVTLDLLFNAVEQSVQKWSIRFPETFSQDGKATDTEIFMVITRNMRDDAGSDWSILIESDIDTDHNMGKKLGLNTRPISNCESLLYAILLDSPFMRYQINMYYEAAIRDMKDGTLQNISLDLDDSWEESDPEKTHTADFVLAETHIEDAGDPRRVTTARFSVDAETGRITDDVFETTFPIEDRYQASLKHYCKVN